MKNYQGIYVIRQSGYRELHILETFEHIKGCLGVVRNVDKWEQNVLWADVVTTDPADFRDGDLWSHGIKKGARNYYNVQTQDSTSENIWHNAKKHSDNINKYRKTKVRYFKLVTRNLTLDEINKINGFIGKRQSDEYLQESFQMLANICNSVPILNSTNAEIGLSYTTITNKEQYEIAKQEKLSVLKNGIALVEKVMGVKFSAKDEGVDLMEWVEIQRKLSSGMVNVELCGEPVLLSELLCDEKYTEITQDFFKTMDTDILEQSSSSARLSNFIATYLDHHQDPNLLVLDYTADKKVPLDISNPNIKALRKNYGGVYMILAGEGLQTTYQLIGNDKMKMLDLLLNETKKEMNHVGTI